LILVDSCGWIEYFGEGPLADQYAGVIEETEKNKIIMPTIVIYEVYKKIKSTKGEEKALEAYAQMSLTKVVELSSALSLKAADISIKEEVAMADAIVIATAKDYDAQIITSDQHFKKVNCVKLIDKKNQS
jgi:toxin FitB